MNKAHQQAETIYVESYSGFMLVAAEAFVPYAILFSNFELVFDAPKRIAPPTWRPIPQLTADNFQTVFPGAPKQKLQRMAVLPTVAEDGSPTLVQIWGDDNIAKARCHVDTYPIYVSGKGHDEKGGKAAHDALCAVFLWLRVLTKQWWIGRPTEAMTGNLHYVVPLAPGRHVEDSPIVTGQGTAPSTGTVRVDRSLWEAVLGKVSRGDAPDPIAVIFADVNYYLFIKEYRTVLLLTCSIAELERDRIIESLHLTKNDLRSGSTDILKHLSTGLGRTIDRNLAQESPIAFEFLKSCWIARGDVAHGRELQWIEGDERKRFEDVPTKEFVMKLEQLIEWLRSVG